MLRTIKSPDRFIDDDISKSLFLAGSIEMGTATDWQRQLTLLLDVQDLVILNPRRDQWDASWEQSIENPLFKEQVEWELNAQEAASVIGMYFAPDTKAPITLLELGLFASTGKLIVCCPPGYWRRGNVQIVCERYGIPLTSHLDELADAINKYFSGAQ